MRLDFGGEYAAREEWLPKDHPERVAWEKRQKEEYRRKQLDRAVEAVDALDAEQLETLVNYLNNK